MLAAIFLIFVVKESISFNILSANLVLSSTKVDRLLMSLNSTDTNYKKFYLTSFTICIVADQDDIDGEPIEDNVEYRMKSIRSETPSDGEDEKSSSSRLMEETPRSRIAYNDGQSDEGNSSGEEKFQG